MFLTHRDYRPCFAHDHHRLCSAGCAASTHLSLPASLPATLHVKIVILATATYDGYAGVVTLLPLSCQFHLERLRAWSLDLDVEYCARGRAALVLVVLFEVYVLLVYVKAVRFTFYFILGDLR